MSRTHRPRAMSNTRVGDAQSPTRLLENPKKRGVAHNPNCDCVWRVAYLLSRRVRVEPRAKQWHTDHVREKAPCILPDMATTRRAFTVSPDARWPTRNLQHDGWSTNKKNGAWRTSQTAIAFGTSRTYCPAGCALDHAQSSGILTVCAKKRHAFYRTWPLP